MPFPVPRLIGGDMTARERELTARYLLSNLDEIALYLKERRWEELLALAEFAAKDAPESLAHTDPALYRALRRQITEFRLRGWSCLNCRRLRELVRQSEMTQPLK